MSKINKLGLQLVAVAAVATLCGPSAFAEDRHRNGTRGGEARVSREDGNGGRTERSAPAQQVQPQESRSSVENRERSAQYRNRGNDTRSNDNRSTQRNDSYNRDNRNNGSNSGSYNRDNRSNGSNSGSYNRESRSNGSYNRGGSYDRNRSYGRNDSYRGGYHGTPSYYHGRVSRYDRYNGGYRVWIVGAPYPFFIPEARFRLFPHFGIGLDIRLGGYYNSAGYYDYYDGPAGVYSEGSLRGVVETVDYRRGTFVLRDDRSGNFVTSVMTGGDRRWDDLRPGDYVEVSGDWTRSGVFQAYRLDTIGDYRR
ncbi:MAG: hypothetical protein QOI24_3290 [Acidobacteriota bacterium]|nr:hypothetical protein [Acidobacteriota bacterium]